MTSHATGASVDTAGPEAVKVHVCKCVCACVCLCVCVCMGSLTCLRCLHITVQSLESVSRVRGTGKQRALRGASDVTQS